MWVTYLCVVKNWEETKKYWIRLVRGARTELLRDRSVRDYTRLPQRTCLDRQDCYRRFWKIDAKVFPLPVNLGHSCITGSEFISSKTTSLPTPPALPLREVKEPRQGAGDLEPSALSASLCLWFPATQEIVNSWSSPQFLGLATIQKPIPQRGPRLHVRNSEVMSKSHLGNGSAPPNVKARHLCPHSQWGPAIPATRRKAGPCATWASPTEGARGPTSCPGGPFQGSQGAREMDYWIWNGRMFKT